MTLSTSRPAAASAAFSAASLPIYLLSLGAVSPTTTSVIFSFLEERRRLSSPIERSASSSKISVGSAAISFSISAALPVEMPFSVALCSVCSVAKITCEITEPLTVLLARAASAFLSISAAVASSPPSTDSRNELSAGSTKPFVIIEPSSAFITSSTELPSRSSSMLPSTVTASAFSASMSVTFSFLETSMLKLGFTSRPSVIYELFIYAL